MFIAGHLLPDSYDFLYSHFPLYHIIVVSGSIIAGINVKLSLFLITGLIFAGTILFIYLLFNFTVKNNQISLLTSLIYANFAIIVVYGAYMVTRVLAYVGFIIMLFLIFKIADRNIGSKRYYILIIFLFIFLSKNI